MNYKLLLSGTVAIFLFAFILYQIIPPILEKETTQHPTGDLETAATTTIDEQEALDNSGEIQEAELSKSTDTVKASSKDSGAPMQPEVSPVTKNGYTTTEVATHNDQSSCWTTINGSVYDITSYIPRHPGGKSAILKICGKDGASLFERQHGGQSRPERTLEGFYIGPLL